MAFTQDQLDALEAAIAEGVTTVKYSDKTVEYRSLSEMLQLRSVMQKELGVVGGGGGRILTSFSKGLNGR